MDPFVEVKQHQIEGIAEFKYTTEVKDGAGKKPVWNETFEVPVTNIDLKMHVHLLEKDTLSNDDLGQFKITPRLFTKPNPPTQFDTFIKEKKVAVLFMHAKWVPDHV